MPHSTRPAMHRLTLDGHPMMFQVRSQRIVLERSRRDADNDRHFVHRLPVAQPSGRLGE